jgi:hypothetical protein
VPIRILRFLLVTAVLAGSIVSPSNAEHSGLRGPVMGYVLDAAGQAIRPVNGIPGSSLLGEPLALPFPVAAAAFSAGNADALIVSGSDDRTVYTLSDLGSEAGIASIHAVEGAISGADRVFLNADSSAGALLASGARQLQLLRGLPASPIAEPPIDLSSIPGTITAVVIDRTASNILIAAADEYGGLYVAGSNAGERLPPRLIANFASPSAVAMLREDQDLVVADSALNEITFISDFAGTPGTFRLADERDGISGPAGLWISADNRKLYIANKASRTLAIWSFELQAMEATFALDAAPTRLSPFRGYSTFVLNDAGDDPLLLLEAAAAPAVYFVPAARDRARDQ